MARTKLTEIEVMKNNLIKAKTAEIRLRHSLAADREVNETIPDLKADFDRAHQLGKAKEFVTHEVSAAFFDFAQKELPDADV